VSPEISTYSRDFKALRDEGEIDVVQSAMGVGQVRHNWRRMTGFTFGLLSCQVGESAFVNARTTSSTVWKEGVPGDFVTLTRVGEGGGRVTLADDVLDLSEGDAYSLSTDQGFTCHTPLYQDISLIAVPRLRLRQLGLPEDVLRPRGQFAPPESVADVLFDFFHAFAVRADKGPVLSRKALTSVNESVLSMAAAMLEENVPAVAPGLHTAAKAYIDEHLYDPGLGPSAVAAALHVSKRTLYRSFADRGHTVAAYIRTARLRRVKRDLDAADGVTSIRDAAERWGFTNPGYFAKLFQQEFGCPPSAYVRNGR
jgi:AraC-like DNA-binding protein